MIRLRFSVLFLLLASLSLTSCLKKKFDNPPDQGRIDPGIPVTNTIAQLNKMLYSNGSTGNLKIADSVVIYGIVTADDRSGNLYKQVVIEDSTGGIAVLIDAYSLYNDYQVGRKIYIKCSGLYLGYYNGLPQLGYTPDNSGAIAGIPSKLMGNFIVKATYPNPVPVTEVTLAQISNSSGTALRQDLINRNLRVKDVQFSANYLNLPYADPIPSTGTSVNMEDCDSNIIILRTSGYANFQPFLVPSGKGTITAIYTVYKGSAQLVIRDTNDVVLTGTRCNGITPPPPTQSDVKSLDSVRQLYTGTGIALPAIKIKGVVISDVTNKNTGTGSIVLQDGNRGISVYFGGTPSYQLGDSLVITVTGDSLISYKGSLEIKAKTSQVTVAGSAKTVTPRVVTILDINSNYSNYEYTLVKIANATVSGGTTFKGTGNGNLQLTDASGSMTLFTGSSATFQSSAVPSVPKTFTGIVNQYISTKELQLRNLNDIQ